MTRLRFSIAPEHLQFFSDVTEALAAGQHWERPEKSRGEATYFWVHPLDVNALRAIERTLNKSANRHAPPILDEPEITLPSPPIKELLMACPGCSRDVHPSDNGSGYYCAACGGKL